jgi:hypothetical protein
MARSTRIALVAVVLGIATGLIVFVGMAFVRTSPPTVDYATGHQPGQAVNVRMQTVGSYGKGDHPTWVSYLIQNPQGQWVHTTLFDVPANTRVNFTIYQYDSGSPLRNQQIGLVQGTIGDTMTVNGKTMKGFNANVGAGAAHTFAIPTLGINVPLLGSTASTLCGVAPCATTSAHNVVKFSIMTPKAVGQYAWQCFVPCGLGWLYGNGGPMQTIGYMDGLMKVVQA